MVLCRVKVVGTLEDQDVHIEDADHQLLYAVENGNLSTLLAWRDFICTHDVGSADLHITPTTPMWRRSRIVSDFIRLMGWISGQKQLKKAREIRRRNGLK